MAAAKRLIVTFPNLSQAIHLEKCCRREKIEGQLLPTPYFITHSCGLCWCCDCEEKTALLALIKQYGIQVREVVNI